MMSIHLVPLVDKPHVWLAGPAAERLQNAFRNKGPVLAQLHCRVVFCEEKLGRLVGELGIGHGDGGRRRSFADSLWNEGGIAGVAAMMEVRDLVGKSAKKKERKEKCQYPMSTATVVGEAGEDDGGRALCIYCVEMHLGLGTGGLEWG